MKIVLVLLSMIVFILNTYSQSDSVDMVVFDTEFQFTDGVYLTFEQAKKNLPIKKSRLISNIEYSDPNFFEDVLAKSEISYYDDKGMKQAFPVNKIWGFSKNGNIYVRMNDTYNKLTYVGNISHFLATINVSYQPMYDPYYYNPYYYNSGWNSSMSGSKAELRQFILDFNSGKIYDYNEKNIEALLTADPPIHDEYVELSSRKKKQLKFYYIRKFNERNPLKIPVYINE